MRSVRLDALLLPHPEVGMPVDLGILRKLTDGDTERQRELITQFVERADRALREIDRGLADHDLAAVVGGADLLQRAGLQAQAIPTLQAAVMLRRAARTRGADIVRLFAQNVHQEVDRALEFTRAWAS